MTNIRYDPADLVSADFNRTNLAMAEPTRSGWTPLVWKIVWSKDKPTKIGKTNKMKCSKLKTWCIQGFSSSDWAFSNDSHLPPSFGWKGWFEFYMFIICYAFDLIVHQFPGVKRCYIDANANKSNAHQCVSVSVKKSWQTWRARSSGRRWSQWRGAWKKILRREIKQSN